MKLIPPENRVPEAEKRHRKTDKREVNFRNEQEDQRKSAPIK
jgi:hypothetical protein